MNAKLSQKDNQFREDALNGDMGRLMLKICLPLTMYQSLNQLFKMLDTMLASMIGSSAVTTVAYLSQISVMLSAVGSGLAVGASIRISEAFGMGDYELVKKRVSTLYVLCGILSSVILVIFVPFAPAILRMFKTPENLIFQGTTYFILELFGMVVTFFNSVYIAIERARGNSRRIFWLNMAVTLTKLALSAVFVLGWKPMGFGNPTINLLSVASLLANGIILGAAVYYMNHKDNVFGFSIHAITFSRPVVGSMLHLAFPVIVEKFAFSYGKVVVNAMCADESMEYHPDTIGATSVSNHISGIVTTPQNGFQEGGSAIISQNLGAGKPERAVSAFQWMFGLAVGTSSLMVLLSLLVLRPLTLFSAAYNEEFADMIAQIYHYEAIATVPLAINSAVQGLLYGLGKTKLTLLVNFCRVFVFRMPILYFLQHYTVMGRVDGPNTIGLCLAVSNFLCGTLSAVIAFVEIRSLCRKYQISFWKSRKKEEGMGGSS